MAFSADPHHSRLGQYSIIRRDEADAGGFWLLVSEGKLDGPEHLCPAVDRERPGDQSEVDRDPPQERTMGLSGSERDPWNRVRRSRYIVSGGLLFLPVAALRGWALLDQDAWYWEVGLFVLLIAPAICWFALIQMLGNHFFGYWSEKRRCSWTATTTRCIAEGTKIRNGLCKSLPPDARRSVHPARRGLNH